MRRLRSPSGSVSTPVGVRIQAAINAGNSVQLPAGIIRLDAPIIIPPGASNITIQGVPGRTRLIRGNNFQGDGPLIAIGSEALSGPVLRSTTALAQGATTFSTTGGSLAPGVVYVWRSDRRVRHMGDVAQTFLQFADQGLFALGECDISKPTATPVDLRAITVCRNITLRGIEVDAAVGAGLGAQGIYAAGVLGLTVEDVTVRRFYSQGLYVRLCRGGTIRRYHSETVMPGTLRYGIEINGSSDLLVDRPTSRSTRKVVLFSQGSARCDVVDGLGIGLIDNPFDTHGSGCYDIRFVRCIGQGACIAGNPAWRLGDQRITFIDCEATSFVVGPNSSAKIVNCKGRQLIPMSAAVDSVNDAVQCPRTGPISIEVFDSVFVNPDGVALDMMDWSQEDSGVRRLGRLAAVNARFEGTWRVGIVGGPTTRVLSAMPGSVATSLEFYGCEFRAAQGIQVHGSTPIAVAFDGGQAWDISGDLIGLSGGLSGTIYVDDPLVVRSGSASLATPGVLSPTGLDPRIGSPLVRP